MNIVAKHVLAIPGARNPVVMAVDDQRQVHIHGMSLMIAMTTNMPTHISVAEFGIEMDREINRHLAGDCMCTGPRIAAVENRTRT